MSFYVFLFVGFISGIFGGMGMGGGTLLIPALTIFCGVEQVVAQGANLVSFFPMAVCALIKHKKEGLLETSSLIYIALPATIVSVAFSVVANIATEELLRKLFGVFLIVLSVFQFLRLTKNE